MTMTMSRPAGNPTDEAMLQCIQNCEICHATCLQTVGHCLSRGGKHADPAHIRLLLDCAEICQTSANFMIRGSDLHRFTCGACAAVCERCAGDCERLAGEAGGEQGGDEQMRACANACRHCADSCRKMAA